MRKWLATFIVIGIVFVLTATPAFAQSGAGLDKALSTITGDGKPLSLSLQVLLLMSLLTVLPSLILMMTSFTRIIIVLSILRQALGLQQTPPNQVLVGLSLFLSMFVMQPVLTQINKTAVEPYGRNEVSMEEGIARSGTALHGFMMKQTREADLGLFMKLSDAEAATPEQVPLKVLIPAFVTSELKTAFQIGFLIFIPFLIIDMVVSSVLMSMGMMMLSPVMISLPFKIMLFVLADGWNLLIGSLVRSFSP